MVSDLYHSHMEDAHVHVTDLECVRGCRRLVAQEAILAGGSSGAIIPALDKVKHEIARGSTCVLILPDRASATSTQFFRMPGSGSTLERYGSLKRN